MKRNASRYSRLFVLAGLVPLLFLDLFVGLPDGAFVGGGAVVMSAAAVVHFYDGERRAGAGWLVFGAALGLVAAGDPFSNHLSLVAFVVLLGGGLLFLVSQQTVDSAG